MQSTAPSEWTLGKNNTCSEDSDTSSVLCISDNRDPSYSHCISNSLNTHALDKKINDHEAKGKLMNIKLEQHVHSL